MAEFADISDQIIQAQTGDVAVREALIREHLPRIRQLVRRLTHRSDVEQLDEYSLALETFNKAIDRYRTEWQVPFFPYARILIRNRIYDWFRHQQSGIQTVHLHEACTSQTDSDTDDDAFSDQSFEATQTNLEFAESMAVLESKLDRFKLSLSKMISAFPKHADSRLMCIRVARSLCQNRQLMDKMMVSGHLPGKDLAAICQIPVKTIERNRSAIILLSLLLDSDLHTLQTYIRRYETEHDE